MSLLSKKGNHLLIEGLINLKGYFCVFLEVFIKSLLSISKASYSDN